MNDALSQFYAFLKTLPLSKKISIAFTVLLVLMGFASMFIWSNRIDYQVLFNNLSQQDAGIIVTKLKERNIPYQIQGDGSLVLVPADQVHDLRLSLAGDGLPKEGNVGFEIFDKTDFGTTRFVQELNYKRALQGELARTIGRFKEVDGAKVFIVLPKDSLFVEEQKPASASIQLDLKSSLPPNKLVAIVHLTASAVEGLDPEQVTVVDTKGRVIFQGNSKDDTSALLSNIQLDYKAKLESEISQKIQSMLETIVGQGKAIVRVIAEIDFTKITRNEEEYDPSVTVVRSSRNIEETSQLGNDSNVTTISRENQQSGVLPSPTTIANEKKKKDHATNYEINRITRSIFQPAGTIKRLSVAAVIDGKYELETLEDNVVKKKYISRSDEELSKFEAIVKSAMGYSEDREDQVSVTSFPFSHSESIEVMNENELPKFNVIELLRNNLKMIINLILVALIFVIIIRPLLKSLKNIAKEASVQVHQLPVNEEFTQLPEKQQRGSREKAFEISKNNPDKASQLLRGWMSE